VHGLLENPFNGIERSTRASETTLSAFSGKNPFNGIERL